MKYLLVTAPLVNKTWLATTRTQALQRALFFLPDPSSEPVHNPLLAKLFPPFFTSEMGDERRSGWVGALPGSATSIMAMPWAEAPDAFKRADASWRRMLVTQPPVQTMVITQTLSTRGGRSQRHAVLKDLALRMGVLYDLAVEFIDNQSSSFRIHWHRIGSERDLTLAVRYARGCVIYGGRVWVEKQFKSDALEKVTVDFGEWNSKSIGRW
ncbi:hypothetical protein C8R45DRAFT_972513 [Mycena sanguinolenta]|nr:hypothetical protein C8R45DRAFT_972513 [Mycena sanguinolenta]